MATNSSSPQYTFYLHKGLPALHLGAPADFFDTRRLVSGGWPGCFGCRRSFSGCRRSFSGCRQCVLFAGGLFLVAGGLLPGTQRTNSASRAQNRGFCALFAFRTPVIWLFEHKIGIFVSEWAIFPRFLVVLTQKWGFCAREEGKVASGSIRVTFLQITAHTFNI